MCIIMFMRVIIQCLVFIICVYLVLVYNSQSGCRRSDRQSVFCSETPTDAQRWFHGEMSRCLLHTQHYSYENCTPCHLHFFFLQIACYHKNDSMRTHETVFRVQFHTGALCGDRLSLHKEDLDHANKGT